MPPSFLWQPVHLLRTRPLLTGIPGAPKAVPAHPTASESEIRTIKQGLIFLSMISSSSKCWSGASGMIRLFPEAITVPCTGATGPHRTEERITLICRNVMGKADSGSHYNKNGPRPGIFPGKIGRIKKRRLKNGTGGVALRVLPFLPGMRPRPAFRVPAAFLLRFEDQAGHLDGTPRVVYRHHDEIGGVRVGPLPREQLLRLDADPHLHGGAPDVVQRSVEGDEVPHVDGGEEVEPVDGRRHAVAARVADRDHAGRRIGQLHDVPPVDVPGGVGVLGGHLLREDDAGCRYGLPLHRHRPPDPRRFISPPPEYDSDGNPSGQTMHAAGTVRPATGARRKIRDRRDR